MNYKDFILLTTVFIFAILFFMSDVYMHLNIGVAGDRLHYIVSTVLPAAGIMTFLYAKNTMCLREQEQRDKMQIARLQQQFAHYQEKMKDEERIRSIYHDLKNHLLVMESRQNTEETRQMAETLRSQIADYHYILENPVTKKGLYEILKQQLSNADIEKSPCFQTIRLTDTFRGDVELDMECNEPFFWACKDTAAKFVYTFPDGREETLVIEY